MGKEMNRATMQHQKNCKIFFQENSKILQKTLFFKQPSTRKNVRKSSPEKFSNRNVPIFSLFFIKLQTINWQLHYKRDFGTDLFPVNFVNFFQNSCFNKHPLRVDSEVFSKTAPYLNIYILSSNLKKCIKPEHHNFVNSSVESHIIDV